MRSKGYIKLAQFFLWSLTILAAGILFSGTYLQLRTLEVFTITFAGLRLGAGLRLDILSCLLFFMIATLGASIGHYSLRYLDGEDRQGYFYKYLLGIIVSASLLVFSSNLLMFFAMWLATSYFLHKLLCYFANRPQALIAARKKAIISRMGDVSLLAAILLTYKTFDSFEFTEVFAKALVLAPGSDSEGMLSLIGILVAVGALTKSAQFPFHFWLPETMETPTPVSALMHAGVINAGGFLIIRMSPVFQHANAAHILLATVGTLSAVLGALCMIVQNDIKKKLAYSTISQMGMMMFACGLGAYSIALFHIFAHSFYKAYAFLATGKLVDESKKIGPAIKAPSGGVIALAGIIGTLAVMGGALYSEGQYLPAATYGAVLLLGLFQGLSVDQGSAVSPTRPWPLILVALFVAIAFYGALEHTLNQHLREVIPNTSTSPLDQITLLIISATAFCMYFGAFVLSARLMQIDTPFLQRMYLTLRNGGYFGARATMVLARMNALPRTGE